MAYARGASPRLSANGEGDAYIVIILTYPAFSVHDYLDEPCQVVPVYSSLPHLRRDYRLFPDI